jgi:prephenate dehydrogenase
MTKKIAIIGLGRIGLSIGMALSRLKQDYLTAGLDRDGDMIREVSKLKVFDSLTNKMPELLKDADIVILSVPFDEEEITLQAISPVLNENSLILDTSPVKRTVFKWAGKILPEANVLLSFTPIISPSQLLNARSGLQAASEDLFTGGLFLVCGGANSTTQAMSLASGIASALRAEIFISDPVEMDGLLAAYELLPKLTAAAYFNSVAREGGWHYGQKLTNYAFSEITRPVDELDEREEFGAAALANRDNTLRVLDNLIRELQGIRKNLEEEDPKGLKETLTRAKAEYSEWWTNRSTGKWVVNPHESVHGEDGFLSGVLGMPSLKKKK